MGISKEEVRFGIVPGLADLADKLAGAFAHSRNREFDFELAKLNKQDKDRREKAAALAKQQKAAEAAEKERRSTIGKDLSRADQLNKQQGALRTPQGSAINPSEAEQTRFPGLSSNETSEITAAQDKLKTSRQLQEFTDLADKTGNESQAAALFQIQQQLAQNGIKLADLSLNLGDDESLMQNLGGNILTNQPELTSESRAVSERINTADLSHLSEADQASAQAKATGLTSELPSANLQPGDIEKQLGRLQVLGESRVIMAKNPGDFFAEATGIDMTNGNKDIIDEVMADADRALAEQAFPGDPQAPLDPNVEADRTIAGAALRQELAGIMAENNVGIYDAIEIHAPGTGIGRSLRNEHMQDRYGTVMSPSRQKLYNRSRSAVDRRSDLNPHEKDAFAMMKTAVESLPDSAILTLVKSENAQALDTTLKSLERGQIKGHLAQDRAQKLPIGSADKLLNIYVDGSLGRTEGGLNPEQQNNVLMAGFGFKDKAAAAILQEEAAMADQQLANQQRELDAHNARTATAPQGPPATLGEARRSVLNDRNLFSSGSAN